MESVGDSLFLGRRGSLAEEIDPGFERLETQREVEIFGGKVVLAHMKDGFFRAESKRLPNGLGNQSSADSPAPEFRVDHDRGDIGEIVLPLDHCPAHGSTLGLGYEKFEAGFSAETLARVKQPIDEEIPPQYLRGT